MSGIAVTGFEIRVAVTGSSNDATEETEGIASLIEPLLAGSLLSLMTGATQVICSLFLEFNGSSHTSIKENCNYVTKIFVLVRRKISY